MTNMSERKGCLPSLFGLFLKYAWRRVPGAKSQQLTDASDLMQAAMQEHASLCRQAVDTRLETLAQMNLLVPGGKRIEATDIDAAEAALQRGAVKTKQCVRADLMEQRTLLARQEQTAAADYRHRKKTRN